MRIIKTAKGEMITTETERPRKQAATRAEMITTADLPAKADRAGGTEREKPGPDPMNGESNG